MQANLIKKKVDLEGGKYFYTFYLKFQNGELVRIQPNSYADKNKVNHSNSDVLRALADDELPFDK